MPWTPFYKAKFIRPIRENLRLLLEANEEASLAVASGAQPLTAYKVRPYRKAIWYNTLWPAMSVVSQHSKLVTSDDASRRIEEHSIVVEIEDSGPDPDKLAEDVERRVEAADAIIMSADKNLFRSGIDENAIAIEEVEVSDHDYLQFARQTKSGTILLQTGSLIVVVRTIER